MWRVSDIPTDAYRPRRQHLLAGVATRLRKVGIDATFEALERYGDLHGHPPAGLTGLVVRQAAGDARMQVTVLRVRRVAPRSTDPRRWVRDLDLSYDLEGDGAVAFELTVLEDPDAGLGHSRGFSAMREVVDTEQAAVDAVRLWHGHREAWHCVPRPPRGERARVTRQVAARRAAAAAAEVRPAADPSLVPVGQRALLAAHLAQLDPGQLCFHFPRDRAGKYARRTVVALAGYGPALSRRGPWLAARAEGGTVVVGVEELIGTNQDHRWDSSPWLWTTTRPDAGNDERWQAPSAEHVRPIVELLDAHATAEALTLTGVDVDADIATLLAGYPTRYVRAEHTETWVTRLHEQLRGAAPWRFATAYRTWQAERRTARRPDTDPVTLFGLKGLNQARKPVVALELHDGVARLVMGWSASNFRVPRALWERPADLEAALLPNGPPATG
jgi:hypothetical protein